MRTTHQPLKNIVLFAITVRAILATGEYIGGKCIMTSTLLAKYPTLDRHLSTSKIEIADSQFIDVTYSRLIVTRGLLLLSVSLNLS
jgi:hypothetical protein